MGRGVPLVISTESGDIFNLEIDPAEVIENVKALIEVEAGILLADQLLFFNGEEMQNTKRLDEYKVGNNDILLVKRRQPMQTAQGQQGQGQQQQGLQQQGHGQQHAQQQQAPTAEMFLEHVRNNPELLQQILANNPPLGEAILSSDIAYLRRFLDHQSAVQRAQEAERQKRMRLMTLDPLSAEYQKALEEEIQMENVNENMEHAMEYTPESFGRVVMLYIDCKANNVPVKAFVDTGAQQTIMSVRCAEKCGIMRLVDRRFSGVAKGVGTARILGRVHMAPIQIGASFFPCSFTILEDQDMEFILGLDMLRRHQCTIDLHNNVLVIGSERTPFLSEKDIPGAKEEDETLPPQTTSTSSSSSTTSPTPAPSIPHPTSPPSFSSPPPSISSPTPTPSHPVPPHSTTSPTQQPAARGPPEEAVQQLMSLGATRQEAVALLTRYRGNVELAASHLFGGGF